MSNPACEAGRMKNAVSASSGEQQLAFPLPEVPRAIRAKRAVRPCTRARASWWFDQMRRVVDEGLDYRAPGVH